jgi:RIB43A
MLQERAAAEARTRVAHADADFRNSAQLISSRREWDLNRPDAQTLDRPAREGDEDPRCGMSSMQKFDGEDLAAGDRSGLQKGQCKEWWEQQALEKAAAAERQACERAASDALTRRCDELQAAAATQEACAKREAQSATMSENARLAAERKVRFPCWTRTCVALSTLIHLQFGLTHWLRMASQRSH